MEKHKLVASESAEQNPHNQRIANIARKREKERRNEQSSSKIIK